MADTFKNGPNENVRVLILEDNPADTELLKRQLRNTRFVLEFRIVDTESGYIKALKEFHPDIILSDYDLPVFDGPDALQLKDELSPETPFILVTRSENEERAIEALTDGATDYVLKNNLSRLLPVVNRVINEAYEHRRRMQTEEERGRLSKELENRVQARSKALGEQITDVRVMREALRAAEKKYSDLVKYAPAAVYEVDFRSRKFVTVNDYMCELSGYSRDELLNMDIMDLLDNDSKLIMLERLKQLFAGEKPDENVEYRIRVRNGREFHGRLNVSFVRDKNGNIRGARVVGYDITERKRIEEDLVKSESKFRAIFEQAPLGIALMDTPTGKFLEINPKFCEILGRSAEEMRKFNFQNLTYPEDIPASMEYMMRLIEGRLRSYNLEKRYFRPDGAIIWVSLTVIAMWGEGETPLRHIAMVEDITERKRAERALRQSEARLKKTEEIAHLGSWELDIVNDRLSWSDEVYRIFGLQPQEFGATYSAFLKAVHPDDRAAVDAAYTGSLRDGRDNYEIEHRVVRKSDGEIRIVREKGEHFRDEAGRVVRSVGMVQDISESKLAEEELKKNEKLLRETNKELEAFSYSVSHDLQTPVRAIKGFAQMILNDSERKLDEETKRRFSVIQENAENVQRLIGDLLTLSRVGRQAISSRRIDMNLLVKDAWKELEVAYPERKLALKMKDLHPAYGDLSLIRQVLVNLLSNAVKYSAQRRSIAVEVGSYQEKGENVYSIKDKGIGFDMKYYDRLFGVFQRLHNASEFEGTGIGLSIAQRIVHLHGGRIWAEGKVNKGAVFYFSLPTKEKPQRSFG